MPLASSNAVRRVPLVSHQCRPAVADWTAFRLTAVLGFSATGLLWLMALLFVWRRLAGALEQPLASTSLVVLALVLAALAISARRFWPSDSPWLPAGTSLALLALALALSLPGTSPWGLVVFWAILGLEEAWTWHARQRRILEFGPSPQDSGPGEIPREVPGGARLRLDPPYVVPQDVCEEEELEEETLSEEILQQLVRRRLPDGSEQLSGWLRVPFAASQRTANAHLAFCPPFAQTPQVTIEQHEGLPARIKLVQSLPFGARLDLKLSEVAEEPSTILLYVQAVGWVEPQASPT